MVEGSGRSVQVGVQRVSIHIQALLLTGPRIWANSLIYEVNRRIR